MARIRKGRNTTHNVTLPPTAVARLGLWLHRTVTRYVTLHTAYIVITYTTINNPETNTAKKETREEKTQDSQL